MRTGLSIAIAVAVVISMACRTESAAGRSQPEAAVAPPAPPPDAAPLPPPSAGGVPDGQWVYTQQYGWVWMTYDDAFTYVPPGGAGEPLEYLYEPTYGWTWVVSPWVWGIGPWPYFGRRGPSPFAWYRHGWWRSPSRWRYRPAPARDQATAHGIRPAPHRGERRARSAPERAQPERRQPQRSGGPEHRGDGDGGRGGAYEPRGRERD
ncbi:MAG TPA: hypothetical protein VF912_17650 [Anaeromyxobacter sp.]